VPCGWVGTREWRRPWNEKARSQQAFTPGYWGDRPESTARQVGADIASVTDELREQCLRDLAVRAGNARPSSTPPAPVGRDPVTDPPPQNPLGR
jgi:hypothetical protein